MNPNHETYKEHVHGNFNLSKCSESYFESAWIEVNDRRVLDELAVVIDED